MSTERERKRERWEQYRDIHIIYVRQIQKVSTSSASSSLIYTKNTYMLFRFPHSSPSVHQSINFNFNFNFVVIMSHIIQSIHSIHSSIHQIIVV